MDILCVFYLLRYRLTIPMLYLIIVILLPVVGHLVNTDTLSKTGKDANMAHEIYYSVALILTVSMQMISVLSSICEI